MARKHQKLGEILVSWNVIGRKALEDALKYADEHRKRIGEALVELELCKEEDVTKALAAQFGIIKPVDGEFFLAVGHVPTAKDAKLEHLLR